MPWVPRSSLFRTKEELLAWWHRSFEGLPGYVATPVEVVVIEPESENEAKIAVERVYAFMRETFDRDWKAFHLGRYTSGARMVRSRYRELRQEGLEHDAAIDELIKVVRWAKRHWWSRPEGRAWCKPDSIFRPTKFHERRA